MQGRRILLIVGGGIAAFKIPALVRLIRAEGAAVTPVLTAAGSQFVTPMTLSVLAGERVHDTLWDQGAEAEIGHIQLSRRADLVVVAPATADLMARMAQGAANDLVTDYSHGMRKKIALAAALLPAPRLLFLDEPFEGIDAIASRQIKDLMAAFVKGGGTIFLTSHILEIVERLCDHIGIIHRGRLVAQGALADLRGAAGTGRTLEETFFDLVGAERSHAPTLGWLS